MKVYIVVRNDYSLHDYDDHCNVSVWLDEQKAKEEVNRLAIEHGSEGHSSGCAFFYQEHDIKE